MAFVWFEATCLPVFVEPRVSEVVLGRQRHHVLVEAWHVLRLQLDRDGAFRHLLQRLDQLLLLAPAVAGDPVERDLHALTGVQQSSANTRITRTSHDIFLWTPARVSNLLSVSLWLSQSLLQTMWLRAYESSETPLVQEKLFASRSLRALLYLPRVYSKYIYACRKAGS